MVARLGAILSFLCLWCNTIIAVAFVQRVSNCSSICRLAAYVPSTMHPAIPHRSRHPATCPSMQTSIRPPIHPLLRGMVQSSGLRRQSSSDWYMLSIQTVGVKRCTPVNVLRFALHHYRDHESWRHLTPPNEDRSATSDGCMELLVLFFGAFVC